MAFLFGRLGCRQSLLACCFFVSPMIWPTPLGSLATGAFTSTRVPTLDLGPQGPSKLPVKEETNGPTTGGPLAPFCGFKGKQVETRSEKPILGSKFLFLTHTQCPSCFFAKAQDMAKALEAMGFETEAGWSMALSEVELDIFGDALHGGHKNAPPFLCPGGGGGRTE